MISSIDWQDDAENASAEERATVADWRLSMEGQDVTLHRFGGETADTLTLPLIHIAEGIARDWWRLFGARDAQISLKRWRMGFLMPDVRMGFDGAAFEVGAWTTTYADPPVTFWGGPSEVLSRQEAENTLIGLVDAVLARLVNAELRGTTAQLMWDRVQASRADPEEATFCEAAGALRLDPYKIDDAPATLIEQASGLFTGEALLEFLSGIGVARGREALDWIDHVERRTAFKSRLPKLRGVADAVSAAVPARAGERGYALGYRRAQAARRNLLGNQTARVCDMRHLSGKLGSRIFELAPTVNGLRALRVTRGDTEHVHLRTQIGHDDGRSGHLFALARAIGDAVCFPEPGRYPVNDLRDAHRQSAGRAFAAEFLAPIDEVASMRADGLDLITIAADFGVSSQVIERQIENEDRIRLACAA